MKPQTKKWYIIILLTIIVGSCISKKIDTGYDFGWQVKSGQWMLEHKEILEEDVSSWSLPTDTTWLNHEWGFELIMASVADSPILYYLLSILLTGLIFALAIGLAYRYKQCNTISFVAISLFFGLVFFIFCMVRPYMLAILLFLLELHLFEYMQTREDSKVIYWLPIISIIWVNGHGGSSNLSYILSFVYISSSLFQFEFGKIVARKIPIRRIGRYLFVTMLSILALLINPYGVKMVMYPYENIANSQMMNFITEWRSPSINVWPECFVFLVLILCLGAMFVQEQRKVELKDLLLFGMCGMMSLVSIRHIMFLWAAAFLIVFKYLPKTKEVGENIILCGLIVVALVTSIARIDQKAEYTPFLSDITIAKIREVDPKRLYNDYDCGGYLLYKDIPVFIDGRYEIYPEQIVTDYTSIQTMDMRAIKLIEFYMFDAFLVKENSYVERYIRSQSKYHLVYRDEKLNLCFYKIEE